MGVRESQKLGIFTHHIFGIRFFIEFTILDTQVGEIRDELGRDIFASIVTSDFESFSEGLEFR